MVSFNSESKLMSSDEFTEMIRSLPINASRILKSPESTSILEKNVIPDNRDIFAYKHLPYVDDLLHFHNHFEINYVYSGTAKQIFEKESRLLTEGELCIIAPYSKHDVLATLNNLVISILVRKSTFDTIFWKLMSQKDLLSLFFRNTLYETNKSNYLLFKTANSDLTKKTIQNIMIESNYDDPYSNNSAGIWMNVLFVHILRYFSDTIHFYDYDSSANQAFDFSLLLQYVQHNYQNVTLNSLAKMFHYSEAYLSKLIKKNLKYNFTTMIKNLRMSHSLEYLLNSQLKISEISELVGYESVDHFSRTFKKKYGSSPQEYRINHRG